jgi:hypothetical protein
MLEGQVALITGSGRGIGKAIALRFAREGADIAVLDVHRERAEATAREVLSVGRHATVKVADVSNFQAVQAAVREVAAELGRLDVLVNNAGIETRAPFLEIRPEEWRRRPAHACAARRRACTGLRSGEAPAGPCWAPLRDGTHVRGRPAEPTPVVSGIVAAPCARFAGAATATRQAPDGLDEAPVGMLAAICLSSSTEKVPLDPRGLFRLRPDRAAER